MSGWKTHPIGDANEETEKCEEDLHIASVASNVVNPDPVVSGKLQFSVTKLKSAKQQVTDNLTVRTKNTQEPQALKISLKLKFVLQFFFNFAFASIQRN